MRIKGKITSWNDEKGYGFITPLEGGKKVFIHIKAFTNRSRRPALHQVTTYALSSDKQGRPCAIKATLTGDRLPDNKKTTIGSLPITSVLLYLIILGVLVLSASVSLWLLALYAGASLITFGIYASDKSAARKGEWRTPEGTLHFLSLVGGWPGAFIAQRKLRHKSRKQPFLLVYWVTVLLNLAIFLWLLTQN